MNYNLYKHKSSPKLVLGIKYSKIKNKKLEKILFANVPDKVGLSSVGLLLFIKVLEKLELIKIFLVSPEIYFNFFASLETCKA